MLYWLQAVDSKIEIPHCLVQHEKKFPRSDQSAIRPSCGPLCMIFCSFHSTKASNECYNLWEQFKRWDIDIGGDILDKRSLQVSYSLNAFQSEISGPS